MFGWSLKYQRAPYAGNMLYPWSKFILMASPRLLLGQRVFWKIGQVDTDFLTGRLQPGCIGGLNHWDTEVLDDRNTFPMFPFLCFGLFLFWETRNMKFFTNLPTPSCVKCPSLQVLRLTNSFWPQGFLLQVYNGRCMQRHWKILQQPRIVYRSWVLKKRNMLHTTWRCFVYTCLSMLGCRILFGKALE